MRALEENGVDKFAYREEFKKLFFIVLVPMHPFFPLFLLIPCTHAKQVLDPWELLPPTRLPTLLLFSGLICSNNGQGWVHGSTTALNPSILCGSVRHTCQSWRQLTCATAVPCARPLNI